MFDVPSYACPLHNESGKKHWIRTSLITVSAEVFGRQYKPTGSSEIHGYYLPS